MTSFLGFAAIRDSLIVPPYSNKTCPRRRAALAAMLLATLGWSELAAEDAKQGPAKPATVDPRTATPADIQKWITQLSDDAFPIRQAAATRLLAAGAPAREALSTTADGPDPESRAAARRLVALIDRTEFNRRLEAFAADADGKRGLTLPGWEKFRKLIGHDPPARALFVDMHRAEGALISAAFGNPSRPPEQLWEDRITRLVTWQSINGNRAVAPPLGSCAAMIFLGSVPEVEISVSGARMIENLIQRPPISESLAAGAPQDTVRRLVVAWILHCPNESEVIVASRLQLTSAINLKGGLPLALAVAGGDKPFAEANPTTLAIATLVVGQFGTGENAEKLERLLEDSRVCMPLPVAQPNQPAPVVQVRDVALCVMLHLTGQKPSDYGYLHARLPPQQIFDIRTLHAANDEVRVAAAAKWKTWRESDEGRDKLKRRESSAEGREPDSSEKKSPP